MKSKRISIKLLFILFISFGLLHSCKDEEILNVIDSQEYVDSEYATIAKNWYDSNRKLSKNNKLYFNKLNVEWTDYKVFPLGSKNKLITVPISSKKDKFYREIAIIISENNPPFGVIKEYTGDPFKENTVLNIYSGSGRHLESALYNYETKNMQYISRLKGSKSLKSSMKKIANASGNFKDGFEIEEVVVTGYQPPRDDYDPIRWWDMEFGDPIYDDDPYIPAGPEGSGLDPDCIKCDPTALDPQNEIIDPCATVQKLEEMLNNAEVQQTNEQLRGKEDIEWASTHYLDLNTNQVTPSELYTSNKASTIEFKYDGYDPNKKRLAIGSAHNHPSGYPPSLTDFYSFNKYYNTLPNNVRKTFAENHRQTIITKDQNYIVSIRDETQWNIIGKKYVQGAKDDENKVNSEARDLYIKQGADFRKYIHEFYSKSAEEKTYNSSYEYALFKVAGEYMNFFTVNTVNGKKKVEPYTIDANGNKVKINCNE